MFIIKSTIVSSVVIGLGILVMMAVIFDGPVKRSLVAENSSKIPISVLLQHMKALPVLAGAVKLSGPNISDREVLTDVSSRFRVDKDAKDVIEYYSSFMQAQGWVPIDSRLIWERRFCKNGISFLIKANHLEHGVDYIIGLTWTEQVRSPSYCFQASDHTRL